MTQATPFERSAHTAGSQRRSAKVFALALGVALLVILLLDRFGPLVAFGAPVGVVVLAFALRDYRLACWLAVFVLPLAPTYLLPRKGLSGMALMYLLLAVSLGALFLAHALRPQRLRYPLWPRRFWLYLAVYAAAAIHGAFFIGTMPQYFMAMELVLSNDVLVYLRTIFLNPCVALAAAMMLSVAVRNAARPALFLLPIAASSLVFAGAVFFYALSSGASLGELASQESRRYLSAIGLHANELGLLLNMGFAFAASCFLHAERRGARVALALAAALLAGAVLLTFSRGAWLGTLATCGYLLLAQRRYALFGAAVLLLPLAVMFLPDSLSQRATHEMKGSDVDAISSGRVDEIWLPLLPDVARQPLLGGGVDSILWSDAAKQRKILPVTHPHSAYLGALLDLGVLGTLVVFLFFLHMWRLFSWLGRAAPTALWRGFFRGGAACILLLLVQGATDDSFMPSRTQPFMWLAYGIAVGFAARRRPPPAAAPPEAPVQPQAQREKAELT